MLTYTAIQINIFLIFISYIILHRGKYIIYDIRMHIVTHKEWNLNTAAVEFLYMSHQSGSKKPALPAPTVIDPRIKHWIDRLLTNALYMKWHSNIRNVPPHLSHHQRVRMKPK